MRWHWCFSIRFVIFLYDIDKCFTFPLPSLSTKSSSFSSSILAEIFPTCCFNKRTSSSNILILDNNSRIIVSYCIFSLRFFYNKYFYLLYTIYFFLFQYISLFSTIFLFGLNRRFHSRNSYLSKNPTDCKSKNLEVSSQKKFLSEVQPVSKIFLLHWTSEYQIDQALVLPVLLLQTQHAQIHLLFFP